MTPLPQLQSPAQSPALSLLANRLIRVYQDTMLVEPGNGELLHLALQRYGQPQMGGGAHYEPQTGGGLWLSHTVHEVADGRRLHVVAGQDMIGVFRPLAATSSISARMLWDLCGEDAELRIAQADPIDPEAEKAPDEAHEGWSEALQCALRRFVERESLPACSPEEVVERICTGDIEGLRPFQRQWLECFATAWSEQVAVPRAEVAGGPQGMRR